MKHLLIAAFILMGIAPALAQTGSGEPIEITAVETVEWLRGQNQYVARKDVIVTQGKMQIFTDLLTADYREGATSSTEIYQLTAEGNVQIKDETNTAYGDKGVYDVIQGIATLTGSNLKLVSPDQTVTATEKMEYYSNERMAKAIGNATVTRPKDTLKANIITAYFKDDSAAAPEATPASPASPLGGSGNLDRLEADGNVVITTPSETLTGNKAIYRADTNTAELRGKVKVVRGENVLEGERAEVDLTTNVSKMFGSETTGGRVRGVFFPSSEKKADNKGQDKKTPPPVTFKAAPAAPEAAPVPAPPALAAPVPVPPETSDSSSPLTPAPARVSPRIDY